VLPVLTVAQSRAGRGGALRSSPFLRHHDTIVNRVSEDPKLTPPQRIASAAIVEAMVPTLKTAFDALSDAAMPDAARLRRGASRRRRGAGMGGGTNEVRVTVDLVREDSNPPLLAPENTELTSPPPPLTGGTTPRRLSGPRLVCEPITLVFFGGGAILTRLFRCRYYNLVLFLTTSDPVSADGPPSTWRVLAFPLQQIAFTIQHGTVLVSPNSKNRRTPVTTANH